MSDKAEHQLPTLDAASDLIDQQIVKRTFFQRIRERGHVLQTKQAATAMWNTAVQLMALPDESAKHAEANDPYTAGEQALRGALTTGAGEAQEAELVKGAAWELAHNPQYYDAALVIKAAEAKELLRAVIGPS